MRNILLIFLSLSSGFVFGQDELTFQEAMKVAMEKNHGIRISENGVEMAKNSSTPGNAGMLPKVDAKAGVNYSNSNADLIFAGDNPALVDVNSESLSYNASVGISYNLFDGMGSFQSYQNLKNQTDLAEIQSRITIESTLLQVSSLYYEAANLQKQVEIAQESMEVSVERVKRLESQNEFGAADRLAILNAQVDLNNDSTNWMNTLIALNNLKRNLNLVMGVDRGIDYSLSEEVEFDPNVNSVELKKRVDANNVNLLLAKSNFQGSEINRKLQQSTFMPRLAIGADYGYNYSESNASIILNQNSLGLTGWVSFSWNLYDGGKKKIALENAHVALESSQIEIEQAQQTVNKDYLIAKDQYENSMKIWKLQERSLSTALLNFERSKELYYKGQLTTLEFREAQRNLNRNKSLVSSAKYTAKLAEIELKRLSGDLLVTEQR